MLCQAVCSVLDNIRVVYIRIKNTEMHFSCFKKKHFIRNTNACCILWKCGKPMEFCQFFSDQLINAHVGLQLRRLFEKKGLRWKNTKHIEKHISVTYVTCGCKWFYTMCFSSVFVFALKTENTLLNNRWLARNKISWWILLQEVELAGNVWSNIYFTEHAGLECTIIRVRKIICHSL
jgi:hypothetical protein